VTASDTRPRQLALFESCASSGKSCGSGSDSSIARSKTSSATSPASTKTAVTASTPIHRVPGSSTRDGAMRVRGRRSAARSTAASARLRTLPLFTEPASAPSVRDPMLQIPRPKTRGECSEEARPCPWVGCRHHLLLEVAKARPKEGRAARPMTIRINRAAESTGGRRPGLRSSAGAELVRLWVADAIEELHGMPYTCAIDVAQEFPDGLTDAIVGQIMGVSRQAIDAETSAALRAFGEACSEMGLDPRELLGED
jgi:hypothetical protein